MFKKILKEKLTPIILIESGEVSLVLVSFKKDVPEIIFYLDEEINFMHEIKPERLKKYAQTSLRRILDRFEREVIPNLDAKNFSLERNFHIFYSSPWVNHKIMIGSLKKDKKFFITEKIIKDIVLETVKKQDEEVMESHIIETKANGYKLENPIGKKTLSMEVKFLVGFLNNEFKETTEEIIHARFNGFTIERHSALKSAISVCNLMEKEDKIVISVDHELTDVALVRKNSLESLGSIPLGTNHMKRKFSFILKKEPDTIDASLFAYTEGIISASLKKKLTPPLEIAKTEYLDNLHKILFSFGARSLPENIIFCSKNPSVKIISSWILNDEYIKSLLGPKKLKISLLNREDNKSLCEGGYNINTLLTSSIYFLKTSKKI